MNFAALGKFIYDQRPKNATGVYVDSNGVRYGFRTNRKKMPLNFYSFIDMLTAEDLLEELTKKE